jgi:hypothetical protein
MLMNEMVGGLVILFRKGVIQGPDGNGHITWVSRDEWLM